MKDAAKKKICNNYIDQIENLKRQNLSLQMEKHGFDNMEQQRNDCYEEWDKLTDNVKRMKSQIASLVRERNSLIEKGKKKDPDSNLSSPVSGVSSPGSMPTPADESLSRQISLAPQPGYRLMPSEPEDKIDSIDYYGPITPSEDFSKAHDDHLVKLRAGKLEDHNKKEKAFRTEVGRILDEGLMAKKGYKQAAEKGDSFEGLTPEIQAAHPNALTLEQPFTLGGGRRRRRKTKQKKTKRRRKSKKSRKSGRR